MTPKTTFTQEIGMKIHKLTMLMQRLADQALHEKADLSFSQFRLLMSLKHHGQLSQKKVASFHGLTEAAVSRQIDGLVQHQLLERLPNAQNRREHVLTLTSQGVSALKRASAILDKQFQALFSVLRPVEQEQFRALLSRLLDTFWEQSKKVCCGSRPKESGT